MSKRTQKGVENEKTGASGLFKLAKPDPVKKLPVKKVAKKL